MERKDTTRKHSHLASTSLSTFLAGLETLDGRRFAFRNTEGRGTGGSFYDCTARYGAVMDEYGRTLWDSLSFLQEMRVGEDMLEELVDKLGFRELLDIPLIALSNGQARRARIARAVLKAPGLLLLDESLSKCSSFPHFLPSSISRSFPNYPTFFPSFFEIAAVSLSCILASRSRPPPFLASFLPYFPPFPIPLSLLQSIFCLPPFFSTYTDPLLLSSWPGPNLPLLTPCPPKRTSRSRSLRIILGVRVQEELPA